MRPEVSYDDLRAAPGNTGNVEENKSLYWNPVIYKVLNPSSASPSYQMVDVWFASAYYVWRTGQVTAFPAGPQNEGQWRKQGGQGRGLVWS